MIFVVICVGCLAIYIYHSWFRRRKSTPKLFYGDSKLHEYIINKVPRLKEPYTPPLGLGNRHLHTIICCLEFSPLNYKRENVHLPDGGLASLDWLDNEACLTDTSPVLVVIPGVGGGKEGINKVCKMAAGRFRVVVFNRRGHCGSLLTTPRLQCFGETSDFRYCVEHIHRKFPKAAMAGVAYSAGTAVLSRNRGHEYQRPNWMLVTTEKGGHCGFIENYKLESWAGKLAVDYIDAVLEYQDAREEDITLKC
ncbi:phospholipase ABHD3-like [Haliotis rufescens]|uniref:phospholipase ABHD3-like n=1 Tax=Haliotis rufescens TaxID=6454 RepID=UPI00201F497D|nr:phospholipase ABHD3-like [Haliotis rufescens]